MSPRSCPHPQPSSSVFPILVNNNFIVKTHIKTFSILSLLFYPVSNLGTKTCCFYLQYTCRIQPPLSSPLLPPQPDLLWPLTWTSAADSWLVPLLYSPPLQSSLNHSSRVTLLECNSNHFASHSKHSSGFPYYFEWKPVFLQKFLSSVHSPFPCGSISLTWTAGLLAAPPVCAPWFCLCFCSSMCLSPLPQDTHMASWLHSGLCSVVTLLTGLLWLRFV